MNATSWGLRCFLCRAFVSEDCPEATDAGGTVCHGAYREPCFFQGPAPLPTFRALSLLGTCRQIYNEAVDLLYTENTFNIDYLDTLKRMIEVAPERLRHIQRVHVTTALWKIWSEDLTRPSENAFAAWENFWLLLATVFTGLQWLRVDLYGTYTTRRLDEESVKPMLQIKALKEFHLEVWRDATHAAPQGRDLATSIPLQAYIRERVCKETSVEDRRLEV